MYRYHLLHRAASVVLVLAASAGTGGRAHAQLPRRTNERGATARADTTCADLCGRRSVLTGVHFAAGTAELLPASDPALADIAQRLTAAAGTFLVAAYVAPAGTSSADERLALNRAFAVKSQLVARGVREDRLVVTGAIVAPNLFSTGPVADLSRVEVTRIH